jgi:multidrug efflux pump
MEELAREVLPAGFSYAWSGQSYEEKKAGTTACLVFAFALVMVFLILAAQYEKWTLPFGVLLAVPFALFGAIAAIWLRGIENDIYFQIGLTVLIALAAKNAILIVEFARELKGEGMSVVDAAVEATRRRFRPILMTSIAFILGVVPLLTATGAGSASQQSLGTVVFGGMIASTLLAIPFVPVFYIMMQRVSEQLGNRAKLRKPKPSEVSTTPA